MEKKLIDVVRQLVDEGHGITYRIRKDGGIIITSIDGVKYSGASGNAVARHMVGANLSTARANANAVSTQKHIEKAKKRAISEDLTKKLKKAQKEWRKHQRQINRQEARKELENGFKEGKNKQGRITKKRVSKIVNKVGEAEASRLLDESIRYSQGKAYSKNVDWIIVRLQDDLNKGIYDSNAIQSTIDLIQANRDKLLEKMVQDIYDKIYDMENRRISGKQMYQDIAEIIGVNAPPIKETINDDWDEVNPFDSDDWSDIDPFN